MKTISTTILENLCGEKAATFCLEMLTFHRQKAHIQCQLIYFVSIFYLVRVLLLGRVFPYMRCAFERSKKSIRLIEQKPQETWTKSVICDSRVWFAALHTIYDTCHSTSPIDKKLSRNSRNTSNFAPCLLVGHRAQLYYYSPVDKIPEPGNIFRAKHNLNGF